MWRSLRATTREGLAEIGGFLHDSRIDLESARLEEAARTVSIDLEVPGWDESRWVLNLLLVAWRRIPVRKGVLTIREVERYSVEDRARIRFQGVNRISLDPDGRRLRVVMVEDGDVLADVRTVDVSIEIAEPIARWSGATTYLLLLDCGEF